MSQPTVQVVIPVYNSAKYIRRCLDSLIGQTYAEWNAIIIDDSSSDNSVEIIKEYQQKDNRITLYALEKNQGVSKVRNLALEKLSEKYTAFLFIQPEQPDLNFPDMISRRKEQHDYLHQLQNM